MSSVAKSATGLSSQHSSDGVEHKKGFSLSTGPPIVMWEPSIQASQNQVIAPSTLMTIEFQGDAQLSAGKYIGITGI